MKENLHGYLTSKRQYIKYNQENFKSISEVIRNTTEQNIVAETTWFLMNNQIRRGLKLIILREQIRQRNEKILNKKKLYNYYNN